MKPLFRVSHFVAPLLLASAHSLVAQNSIYMSNAQAADFSGFGPSGGTVIVPYTLASGPELAGVGASFNVTYTYSAFSNAAHMWGTAIHPDAYNLGIAPDGASLYTGLPANNQQNEFQPDGEHYTGGFAELLNLGQIDELGTFTVSTSSVSIPGYQIVGDTVYHTPVGRSVDESIPGGPPGADELFHQALFNLIKVGGVYQKELFEVSSHGATTTFAYSAFGEAPNDPALTADAYFGLTAGILEFAAVPEPSSALLLGTTGLLLTRRNRRRQEA